MKLIILNGPFGVGKTTIGWKLSKRLPLSFFCDLDTLRASISHYKEDTKKSGDLMYSVARNITRACLMRGADVIIDRMIFHGETVDSFIEIGEKHDARIFEFFLWADKDTCVSRAKERGFAKDTKLTIDDVHEFWETINTLRAARPSAIIIDTNGKSAEQTTQEIWEQLCA